MNKNYQHHQNRTIFRLRDPKLYPQKDFDPSMDSPPRYPTLADDEKLHVAEFIEFLLANDEAVETNEELRFYIRDHESRPPTTELLVPEDKPAKYSELGEKEKAHVFEFISFLVRRIKET